MMYKVKIDPKYNWGTHAEFLNWLNKSFCYNHVNEKDLPVLSEPHGWNIVVLATREQYADMVISLRGVADCEAVGTMNVQLASGAHANHFSHMAEKMATATSGMFNERVEVHMPGQALATYNETMLLQDSCTDALQNEIDSGWRIIAVCPQPDQRRPDYILGRYNPSRDIREMGNGAAR